MAAVTREGLIFEALMEHVSQQPTELHVVYPSVVYPDDTRGQIRDVRYILVAHLPNRPNRVGIGTERGDHVFRGILSLSLMTEIGIGNLEAVELTGELISHFPADLRLSAGFVLLRVTQEPYAAPGYRDEDRWRTPIIVDYETMSA